MRYLKKHHRFMEAQVLSSLVICLLQKISVQLTKQIMLIPSVLQIDGTAHGLNNYKDTKP
jgi:hypothetical protein